MPQPSDQVVCRARSRALRASRTGWARGTLLAGLCGAVGAGALAQPAEVGSGLIAGARLVGRIELERVEASARDAPGAAQLYRIDPSPAAPVSEALRTRWWIGQGVGSVGAGADWAATPVGSSLRPWRPVVGVRADVTPQTRLVYERRAAAPPWAERLGAGQPESRVAMEFKSARNPAQNLRGGLLRVQLSNSSALMLKPRGGGLVVSYRSQF